MSMTLLVEFDVFSPIFENVPAAASANALEELAEVLWGKVLTPSEPSEIITRGWGYESVRRRQQHCLLTEQLADDCPFLSQ